MPPGRCARRLVPGVQSLESGAWSPEPEARLLRFGDRFDYFTRGVVVAEACGDVGLRDDAHQTTAAVDDGNPAHLPALHDLERAIDRLVGVDGVWVARHYVLNPCLPRIAP